MKYFEKVDNTEWILRGKRALSCDWQIECESGWWTCTRQARKGESAGVLTEASNINEAVALALLSEKHFSSLRH
jgi:hypothetical protein